MAKSANYGWLYGTACISPSIEASVAKLEGKIVDRAGRVRKTTTGIRKKLDGGFDLWTGSWELVDLPSGIYTLELTAIDKSGQVVTSREARLVYGDLPQSALKELMKSRPIFGSGLAQC